ncbi:cytochrome P450 [Hygrophoropsis aurantiaca]|uniref:Cytochrome P450 n=1 Tax=Hygrophoropsis aurantiaca TaxID=72124 RepID=A0ACB8AQH8_9AGAM|nr:cytochrome P450 [Hygrophoropsis aurantiaca]
MPIAFDANLGGLAGVICLALLVSRIRKSASSLPLPPGPPSIPFLGNVIGLKPDTVWLSYTEWAVKYGEIMYTTTLNQRVLVISSERVATDLMDKRSNIYSDRLQMALVDVFGLGVLTSSIPYGPLWRKHRRLYHQVFQERSALRYRPQQLQKAYNMVEQFMEDPEHYLEHLQSYAAAVVMSIVYGYDIYPINDPIINAAKISIDMVTKVATPEKSAIIAVFPSLLKLPAWFPGMSFLNDSIICRKYADEMFDLPYEYVKKSLAEGVAKPSMVSDAIQRYKLDSDETSDPEMTQVIKCSSATAFAESFHLVKACALKSLSLFLAASDTTNATILVFFIAMMQNPEIQARAHAELDRVVGDKRLPVFEDRAALPYIDALIREVRRWRPITPIGVPHATVEDDVYEGYYIPKGVAVVSNLWAISRNEAKYPSPETFRPERFIGPDGELTDDTVQWSFGFGRRICPGRHIADAALWGAIASFLAVFRIEKPDGPEEEIKWKHGLTICPLPFKCKFVPRRDDINPTKLKSLIELSMGSW